MNIVKVNSKVVDDHAIMFSGLYCWCIRWQHIVSFDDYTINEVMQAEKDGVLKEGAPHASFDEYVAAGNIDMTQTTIANDISKWVEFNNFNPDGDITIDELKMFRTWLAQQLLVLDAANEDYKTTEMLSYYANEMNDSTIEHLSAFAESGGTLTYKANTSTCACNSLTYDSLTAVSVCDSIASYRKGVYQVMVTVFSDISYWTEREKDFINEFKLYIDGIIKANLPLYSGSSVLSGYDSTLRDCSCLTKANTAQEIATLMLKNLSTALGYIADGKVQGNRSFIAKAFNEWAVSLYEKMRW